MNLSKVKFWIKISLVVLCTIHSTINYASSNDKPLEESSHNLKTEQKKVLEDLCTSKNQKKLSDSKMFSDALEFFDLRSFESVKDVISLTQKNWLRKAGIERAQIDSPTGDVLSFLETQETLYNKTIEPEKQDYNFILCLGAAGPSMKIRLEYLKQGIQSGDFGKSYSSIFMVYGYRKASSIDQEYEKYENEEEIARHLVEDIFKDTDIQVELIGPDSKNLEAGKRHNTRETLIHLMEEYPKLADSESKLLVISSNPHCDYQKMVAINTFGHENVATAGPKVSKNGFIKSWMDNLARLLYELNTYQTNNK